MNSTTATSRRTAAAWCLLALLVAILAPGLHGLQDMAEARGGAHTCCSHGHAAPSHAPTDLPSDDPADQVPHDEDVCPVCQLIYLASAGCVPVWTVPGIPASAPVATLAIRSAAAPVGLIAPPQLSLRGPPRA